MSLALSLVIGAFVGVAVRYAAGRVSNRPDAEQVVAALAGRGFRLRRFERVPSDDDARRDYLATTTDGSQADGPGARPGADPVRCGLQRLPFDPYP